jgi:hypothetical protein
VSVTALRQFTATVDDTPLAVPTPTDWKQEVPVRLPTTLPAGPHRFRLTVTDPIGPPLVRARCDALGIATGWSDWRVDGAPAVPVSLPFRPALSDRFGPSFDGLRSVWLPSLAALLGGMGIAWRTNLRSRLWGPLCRWAVLGLWVFLGIANLYRIPLSFGYDAAFHYDYIRYLVDHARLPPPDGGVQFFQAPLSYIVSAGLWKILAATGASADRLPYLMRLVPLACGVGLADVCYRAARHAFPGRPALHAVAVLLGGLVPVNLYMGLAVSNEPMAALLGGCVALACLRFITRPAERDDPKRVAIAGLLLGAAILTKVTAGLWAVPLAVALRRPRRVAVAWAVAAVVCGPWVVRTWRYTGTPALSHTVLADGQTWWQDPGYRTPRQLLTFGRGLTRVAYGGVDSVWDSLYATTWGNGFLSGTIGQPGRVPFDLRFMGAGLWFGLVPMGLAVIAALGGRAPAGFAAGSIGLFVAAVVWVYLTLPIYSCAKGSYLLSTLPCAAVLVAAGCDRVAVGRRSRAVVVGLLTCWAATSYLAYVVPG